MLVTAPALDPTKLLTKQCRGPRVLVTDQLRSYQVAHRAAAAPAKRSAVGIASPTSKVAYIMSLLSGTSSTMTAAPSSGRTGSISTSHQWNRPVRTR